MPSSIENEVNFLTWPQRRHEGVKQ